MKDASHHRPAYWLIAALLAVDVTVFMLQKAATRTQASSLPAVVLHAVKTPMLWVALALALLQLWLWTTILRRSDIGWAYVFTGLAYPLTMIAACLFWQDHYDPRVWLGALLIAAGVAVLGPHTTAPERGESESKAHTG